MDDETREALALTAADLDEMLCNGEPAHLFRVPRTVAVTLSSPDPELNRLLRSTSNGDPAPKGTR